MKMKTKARLIVPLVLSLAGAGAACDPGPAGPPTEPSDPTKTGYEPRGGDADVTTGANASIDQLCAEVCMRLAAFCPSSADPSCAMQCASTTVGAPMCESVFRVFLVCLTTSPLVCNNGSLDPNVCQKEIVDVSNCESGISTGTAGASGGGGGSKL